MFKFVQTMKLGSKLLQICCRLMKWISRRIALYEIHWCLKQVHRMDKRRSPTLCVCAAVCPCTRFVTCVWPRGWALPCENRLRNCFFFVSRQGPTSSFNSWFLRLYRLSTALEDHEQRYGRSIFGVTSMYLTSRRRIKKPSRTSIWTEM